MNKSHQFINTIDINVMYHPEFKKGRKIAGEIYSYYTRNIKDNKSSQCIGIPVYYTFSKESFLLNNINNHNSNFHVIVVLIDDNMIADDIWLNYLKKVLYHEFSEYSKSFVIPVLYTENGFDYIGKFHSINLFYIKEYILQLDELFFCLNEELIKYMKRELNQKEQTKIFISHAKKDGNIIGKKIRDYIASHSHSQTFYDENNIMI